MSKEKKSCISRKGVRFLPQFHRHFLDENLIKQFTIIVSASLWSSRDPESLGGFEMQHYRVVLAAIFYSETKITRCDSNSLFCEYRVSGYPVFWRKRQNPPELAQYFDVLLFPASFLPLNLPAARFWSQPIRSNIIFWQKKVPD